MVENVSDRDVLNTNFAQNTLGDPNIAMRHILGEILHSYQSGDFVRTMELIEKYALEAWFGFRVERFVVILEALVNAGVDVNGVARSIYNFVVTPDLRKELPPTRRVTASGELPNSVQVMNELTGMFLLRLQGNHVQALHEAKKLDQLRVLDRTYFDGRGGWGLFLAVQQGITAMLAGDFRQAIQYFSAAQGHIFIPSLAFLTRDAYIKEALIQVTFGDNERAAKLLESAEKIPKIHSWVEAGINTSALIAGSLIQTKSAEEALSLIEAVNIRDLNEMWPFYIIAYQRVMERFGGRSAIEERMRMLSLLPFPRKEGQGFSGSVMASTRAANALARGDSASARDFLNAADPKFLGTLTIEALLELTTGGNPARAEQIALEMRPLSRGLRQSEIWRIGILAQSSLMQNGEQDCAAVLRLAVDLSGGLRPVETSFFMPQVRAVGEKLVEGWPTHQHFSEYMNNIYSSTEPLSRREREVLNLLALQDFSREELADELFISMNTLKTHLQSIYRKLGVQSRIGAIVEAERRGII